MDTTHTRYERNGFKVSICFDNSDSWSPDDCGNEECFLGQMGKRSSLGRKGYTLGCAEEYIPWGQGPWDPEGLDKEEAEEKFEEWKSQFDPSWQVYPVRLRERYETRLEECEWSEAQGAIFVRLPWEGRELERLCYLEFDPDALKDELIDQWNMYFSGDVHEVVIEDGDGEHIDSLGGIYGHREAREEADKMADHHARYKRMFVIIVLRENGQERVCLDLPYYVPASKAGEWAITEGPLKGDTTITGIVAESDVYKPYMIKEEVA